MADSVQDNEDELVDQFADRALTASPLQHTNLDVSTFGKAGSLAVSHGNPVVPAMMHSRSSVASAALPHRLLPKASVVPFASQPSCTKVMLKRDVLVRTSLAAALIDADVLTRTATAAAPIAICTLYFTLAQVVKLSKGVLPPPTFGDFLKLVAQAGIFQFAIKMVHFNGMRLLKIGLDSYFSLPAAATAMLSYGTVGIPLQAIVYNSLTAKVYDLYGKSMPKKEGEKLAPLAAVNKWYMNNIRPGIVWTFLRECMATGGGLAFGPTLKEMLFPVAWQTGEAFQGSALATKFLGGLIAGSIGAFITQWMHNAALTAPQMLACGEETCTIDCLKRAYDNFGYKFIWRNYHLRVCLIAFSSAMLTLTDATK